MVISKIVTSVTAMDVEIQVAVQFVISFMTGKLSDDSTEKYSKCVLKLLIEKFEGHWYPDKPAKGSAYRCISIESQIDNVLLKAAQETNIQTDLLSALLPKKLDLWIDPAEVSYRIGEHGAVVVIYKEGDDCVNSTSRYLADVLSKLPTITQDCSSRHSKSPASLNGTQNLPASPISGNGSVSHDRRPENRLSPTARTFVSRHVPGLQFGNAGNSARAGNHLQQLASLEYLRKVYWPLLAASGYDPLMAQIAQNYILAQELARYEAQRVALQSHYLKMQNMHWPKKSAHSSQTRQTNANGNSNGGGLQISA